MGKLQQGILTDHISNLGSNRDSEKDSTTSNNPHGVRKFNSVTKALCNFFKISSTSKYMSMKADATFLFKSVKICDPAYETIKRLLEYKAQNEETTKNTI